MGGQIILLPLGKIEEWVLDDLREELAKKLNYPVKKFDAAALPDSAYNLNRKQYHSSSILRKIRTLIQTGEGNKVLAIVNVDLYAEGLNFVFGEAEFEGQMAIISLARLHQSFYGYPEDISLFRERARKEAVHELGHVLGLTHCLDASCVMHFSNSLLDTDRKNSSFCSRCQDRLGKLKR